MCTHTKSVSWVMLGKQDGFSSMLLLHVEFLINAGAVVVGLLDLWCTLPVCRLHGVATRERNGIHSPKLCSSKSCCPAALNSFVALQQYVARASNHAVPVVDASVDDRYYCCCICRFLRTAALQVDGRNSSIEGYAQLQARA